MGSYHTERKYRSQQPIGRHLLSISRTVPVVRSFMKGACSAILQYGSSFFGGRQQGHQSKQQRDGPGLHKASLPVISGSKQRGLS